MNLTLTKVWLPASVTDPIVATFYYKEYYAPDYILLDDNVTVNADGTILSSPPLSFAVNPENKYMLRVENQACGSIYEQSVIITPYCPLGYELSPDLTYCFYEETVAAIPPSNPEVTIEKNATAYSTCGSYIYAPGYSNNGTGTATQITTANSFWVNGAGTCVDNNTSSGPLNRAGVWATTTSSNQTVGFSRCITITEAKTYYIGMGVDNYGMIYLDGNLVLSQNETAVNAQFGITGACFKVWHIFPVDIPEGTHTLEVKGFNISGNAAVGVEIYANTAAEIIAATDYTGLDLVFSSKDYIGMPVQIGSNGIGYSCEAGYSLSYCDSPIVCKRIVTTPVQY